MPCKMSWRGVAALKQRPKIGARALRLAPGCFRRFAEAEIAVDQALALIISGRYAGGGERAGIGLALVAQRIEPRGADDRRREPGKVFCAQCRDAPVGAVAGVAKIM